MKKAKSGIASMSGYGRGARAAGGWRAVCEIRSVNHRYLDMAVSVPSFLVSADSLIRRLVRAALKRGRADITISLFPQRGSKRFRPAVDLDLARDYGRSFSRLARRLKLPPPRVEALAQLPGVVSRVEDQRAGEGALAAIRGATGVALSRLLLMRRREGAALAADVRERVASLQRTIVALAIAYPRANLKRKEKAVMRLEEALGRLSGEKRQVSAREIVGMVERGDISEEVARLKSLVEQVGSSLGGGVPAGRRLDFLAQELQREVNTIGAKSADAGLARLVVSAREDVERIREQVQNIE